MERLLPQTGLGVTSEGQPDLDFLVDVAALTTAIMSQALTTATEYARAAGREQVHTVDVRLGMQHCLLPGSEFWTDPQMPLRAEQAKQALLEEEEEEEPEEQQEEELDLEGDTEAWTRAPETSQVARELHQSDSAFQTWEPPVGLMTILRDSVVRMRAME